MWKFEVKSVTVETPMPYKIGMQKYAFSTVLTDSFSIQIAKSGIPYFISKDCILSASVIPVRAVSPPVTTTLQLELLS